MSKNSLVTGAHVNATTKDGSFVGKIIEIGKGRARVQFTDDSAMWVPMSKIELRKRGRKSLAQTLTPSEMQAEVDTLMDELKGAKSTDDKKRLRRLLRRRNHRGGLGLRPITVKSINE